MKTKNYLLIALAAMFLACGSAGDTTRANPGNEETLEQKNRIAISLINRIRQLPGIVIRNGVPIFTRTASEVQSDFSVEPLYIVDDYIVGNSFRSVNELVPSVEVKKIEAITGPETSFYGARGGNGVIKITTYK